MRVRSIHGILAGAALAAVGLFGHVASATVPQTLGQMGRLFDAKGEPVTGQLKVTLSVYDSATATTALWTEDHSVTFENGYFALEMGSIKLFTANIFDGSVRYLGITIGTDVELSPRSPLSSAPFALIAGDVNGDAHPTSVSIAGVGAVIDSTGKWVGSTQGIGGATGARGPAGSLGVAGATGRPGFPGPLGVTGRTGDAGLQGPIGAVGVRGGPGSVGNRGPIGKTGLTGIRGATGPQGPPGLQGAVGLRGSAGSQGVQGMAGGKAGGYLKFTGANSVGPSALSEDADGNILIGGKSTSPSSVGAPPILDINAATLPNPQNVDGIVSVINVTTPSNAANAAGDGYWILYAHDSNISSGQTLPGGEGGVWLGRDYDYDITNEVGVQFGTASNTGVGLFTNNAAASFRVEANGDVRIGAIAAFDYSNASAVVPLPGSGPGGTMLMSGGPIQNGTVDGENSDVLFLQRYNVAPNVTELRVGLGDDGDGTNTSVMDAFVIGNLSASGSDRSSFEPKFRVRSDGQVSLWNAVRQRACHGAFATAGVATAGTATNTVCATARQTAATFDVAERTCQAAGAHVMTGSELALLATAIPLGSNDGIWIGSRVGAGAALYTSAAANVTLDGGVTVAGDAVDNAAHTNTRGYYCVLSSTYDP